MSQTEQAPTQHLSAEQILGPTRPQHRAAGSQDSRLANRRWWDADAGDYHAEHAAFLGDADFVWCPEGLREDDAHLLGEVEGLRVLEVGCGSAPCGRWLTGAGAQVTAFDLSAGMLSYAADAATRSGLHAPLVQADASAMPFASQSFDIACSAFGAVPFVADSALVMREVARVLRPGGRWVFSVTHPMRWIFLDDPGEKGLQAVSSYFDRSPYVEVDSDGVPAYVEHHRTLGDRIREIVAAGFTLTDLIEPEWPDDLEATWGQWSRLRGEVFPGTAIFVCDLPG
ncbi:class I SAM-dependent methyltransferase [Nakamurella antarctica]|uniref:Class I SAM-dependent methyltransferase n=1 Tax=Nakamurella antarctica TaxID=1902245 RepID=A0A3G8ZQ48_9ACTN|nr:class I SAM-dependent methyltransferase [Nakamurella antarctica]